MRGADCRAALRPPELMLLRVLNVKLSVCVLSAASLSVSVRLSVRYYMRCRRVALSWAWVDWRMLG